MFVKKCSGLETPQVFVGTPTWGNYEPLCRLVGLDKIVKYQHYDPQSGLADFKTILQTVRNAPRGSIFILQGCCHNPTGADLTSEQWHSLAANMKANELFPFFDIAYQGLGRSVEDDAEPIRLFVDLGFEMVACQSFSKNHGLYGERCGVLHVVSRSEVTALRVKDQLRSLIRWDFSSSPAYGSRLVSIISEDTALQEAWLVMVPAPAVSFLPY